ncbi:hypothetical protein H4R35_004616 [Dimargaris xerosporica]|nr:hypothetical protein H4R35_004616 [Dimargaris xerosporica]
MKTISVALTCGLAAALSGGTWGRPIETEIDTTANALTSANDSWSWRDELFNSNIDASDDETFTFPNDHGLPKLSSPLHTKVPEYGDWATDEFIETMKYSPAQLNEASAAYSDLESILGRNFHPLAPNLRRLYDNQSRATQDPVDIDVLTDSGFDEGSIFDNGSEDGYSSGIDDDYISQNEDLFMNYNNNLQWDAGSARGPARS